MEKIKCPECGSQRVHAKINEIFCGKCGFVLEEQVFSGS